MKFDTIEDRIQRKKELKIFVVDRLQPSSFLFAGYVKDAKRENGGEYVDLEPYFGLNVANSAYGSGLVGGKCATYYGLLANGPKTTITTGFKTHKKDATALVRKVCGESNKTFEIYLVGAERLAKI